VKLRFSAVAVLLAASLAAGQEAKKIDEPFLKVDQIAEMCFGDDEVVALLAAVAAEDDPLARAWAVQDLGKAHNRAGLRYISRALRDKNTAVRVAAAVAAAEIGFPEAENVVIQALDARRPDVLLAALSSARKLELKRASEKIRRLLANDDALVRAAAAGTLTALKTPATQTELRPLIDDSTIRVRLAGLRNAMLLSKADQLVDDLLAAADRANPPAVRSAAMEALGKFAFDRSRRLLAAAADLPDPLIRRGVVRAYHNAGRPEKIGRFLKDSAPTVRLAAIRAAGDLNLTGSVDRLFRLMLEAPDLESHLAARRALGRIATEAVTDAAARAIPELMETSARQAAGPRAATKPAGRDKENQAPPAIPKVRRIDGMRVEHIPRNIAACCWLLGELKSKKCLDYQLAVIPKLSTESEVFFELVPALAKIGDRRAIEPLRELLKRCHRKGIAYLRKLAAGSPPPPYEPQVPRRIMEAFAKMKAHETVDQILAVADTNIARLRLSVCASYAARALPDLATDENRQKIESFLIEAIEDDHFSLTARFYAAKAAARMKVQGALPALRKVLAEERPGRRLMHAAAWAIQEISGQSPRIPQPRLKQGNWVINKIK